MGARESDAMKKARDLILNEGYNQYRAANAAGISRGAISKSKWYRDHMKTKQGDAQNDTKKS